jgi:hypothetical protein
MKRVMLLLSLIISLSLSAQEKVYFAEQNISITPPTGFKQVDFIIGFFNYSNGASIQIQKVDSVAYVLVAQGLSNENLNAQSVTLISKENVTAANGKKGILVIMEFEVTQNEEVRKYERMSFLTGDMNNTIFINANYPLLVKDLVYDAIKNSLLTAKFEN